ncbi:MAG: hypothetical protein PVI50_00625 [Gammaproteobacteria bacterium]|jgi:hypothetical protein
MKSKRRNHTPSFKAKLSLYVTAFPAGGDAFKRAFDECLDSGEAVRDRLGICRHTNGRYTDRLDRLAGNGLCSRILRPSLLDYETTRAKDVLSYGTWLVTHTATGSEPFLAHK